MATKNINFILNGMTSLRYFIPLTIEANKRSIRSKYFTIPSGKYNCPYLDKNYENLVQFSKEHDFDIEGVSAVSNYPGLTFFIEGDGIKYLGKKHVKVCLTYMTDFIGSSGRYVEQCDKIIFPSHFFAQYYKKEFNKNLYLGSPKYDIELKDEDILSKYNLTDDKKALVMFPRNRDLHLIDIKKIYRSLSDLGYKIMVKTRGKDPVTDGGNRGDHYFEDCSWFPHTGMELIKVSDIVINFSSTAIKECVLLNKPVVNFHIKPFKKPLDFLYNYGYCDMYEKDVDEDKLKESIQRLTTASLEDEFELSIQNHLFPVKDTCKRILDYLEVK